MEPQQQPLLLNWIKLLHNIIKFSALHKHWHIWTIAFPCWLASLPLSLLIDNHWIGKLLQEESLPRHKFIVMMMNSTELNQFPYKHSFSFYSFPLGRSNRNFDLCTRRPQIYKHKFLNVVVSISYTPPSTSLDTMMISQVNDFDFWIQDIIKIATITPEYFVDVWLLVNPAFFLHHYRLHTFRSVKISRRGISTN